MKTEARQQQIVEATLALLAEMPLSAVTTRRLARALGLTQPALFRHFRSRDALLLAVVDHARASVAEVVEHVLAAGDDVATQLEVLVFTILRYTEANPGLARLLFGDGSSGAAGEPVRAALRQLVAMQRNLVAELAREGQRAGHLRADLSPSRAASVLIGMIQGIILQWELDGRARSLTAEAAPVVRLWLEGAGATRESRAQAEPSPAAAARADVEAAPSPAAGPRLVSLDARPILAGGEDPLEAILAAVEAATPGGLVALTTPFRPTPLLALLDRRGHQVSSREAGDGLHATAVAVAPCAEVVDLRDLPAPQPLEAVLQRAAALQPGESFAARTPRIPALLLPQLQRRGLAAETHEEPDGAGLILVWRPR